MRTSSAGEKRSMMRLWMRIWKRSKVIEPSPQGVLRVVIFKTLVGIRTGPETLSCLWRALFLSSEHTFSRASTLQEVRVILMRWMATSSAAALVLIGGADIFGDEEQKELTVT